MLDLIALACLIIALLLLAALSYIDLKTRLLPNELVLGLATVGIVFHLTTLAVFLSPIEIALGGIIGFGTLFLLRAVANYIYQDDALGLGDVKLLGAGGLWLGPDGILLAMAIGASASLIHGAIEALRIAKITRSKPSLSNLQIPAGPGFAVGLILTALYIFQDFRPY